MCIKKLNVLAAIIYTACNASAAINTQSTHVFVHNCTSLRFNVSIEYEGAANKNTCFWQKGTDSISPFALPKEKNMVLETSRLLPQGEHLYTIKLIHAGETLYLKQKFISTSDQQESELGISLESICLRDPWFMNKQAQDWHEHILNIDCQTIMIIYYSYPTETGEDIQYTLCEQCELCLEKAKRKWVHEKQLTYGLTVPINTKKTRLTQPLTTLIEELLPYLAPKPTEQKNECLNNSYPNSIKEKITQSSTTRNLTVKTLSDMTVLSLTQATKENSTNFSLKHTHSTKEARHELLKYIAHKESLYSVVDSKTTTRFWIAHT